MTNLYFYVRIMFIRFLGSGPASIVIGRAAAYCIIVGT